MSEGPAPSDASDRRKRPRGEREGRGGAEAEGKEEQLWGRRGGGGAGETGGPQGRQGTGDGVGEGAGKRHRGTLGGEDGGAGECSLHSNLTGELQALDVEAEMEGGSGSGRS